MVWRVETTTTGLGGAPYLSVFIFNDSVGTAEDAVQAVENFWTTLAPNIVNECTMTTASDVHVIDATTGMITGVVVVGVGAAVVGTGTSEPAPVSTQGLIQTYTDTFVAGRQLRGRLFVPGVPSAGVTLGKPSTAYKSAVATAANDLRNDANSQWQVWSRTHGIAREIDAVTVWSEFAVLRSRRD